MVPSKKFKGVFFDQEDDTWLARVELSEGYTDCGHFLDEEAAARAYDHCAQQLLDNPELNFPDDQE